MTDAVFDSFADNLWGSAFGTTFDWAAVLPSCVNDLGAEPAPF